MVLIPTAVVLGVLVVVGARWLRTLPAVQGFVERYPGVGTIPDWTPAGFPPWLSWTHFLSAFLLLFIVRSGLAVRSRVRPPAFWTRDPARFPRTSRTPTRLSLHVWWHLVVDVAWVATGTVYVVLLFASGYWARIVPTHPDVVPNAISAGLQYVSLDWPQHDTWASYNSLQLLSYFATVFIASPLAIVSGLRLSPAGARRPLALIPEPAARWTHWAVTVYFIAFTVVHVFLVLTTGARENLAHMFAGRDDGSILGVALFFAALLVTVVAAAILRPPAQTAIAERTGTVRRMPPAQ